MILEVLAERQTSEPLSRSIPMFRWLLIGWLSAAAPVLAQTDRPAPDTALPRPSQEYFRLVDRFRASGYEFASRARGDMTVLLDTTTIESDVSAHTVKVWLVMITEHPRATNEGRLFSATKAHAQFDCARERWRWTYVDYENSDRVIGVDPSTTAWMDVPPGSHADNAMIVACVLSATATKGRRPTG